MKVRSKIIFTKQSYTVGTRFQTLTQMGQSGEGINRNLYKSKRRGQNAK